MVSEGPLEDWRLDFTGWWGYRGISVSPAAYGISLTKTIVYGIVQGISSGNLMEASAPSLAQANDQF